MNNQHKNIPILTFANQKQFEEWLETNYADPNVYWLQIAKKGAAVQSITYEEAREAALKYGWIDGLLNRLDENYYLLKFCHRRPKSNWSEINIAIVRQLMRDGKMKAEGLKEFQLAEADGRIPRY